MRKVLNEQGPRFDIETPLARKPAKHTGEELALIEAQNLVVSEIRVRGPEALGFEARVMDEDVLIYRVVAEARPGLIGASTYRRRQS